MLRILGGRLARRCFSTARPSVHYSGIGGQTAVLLFTGVSAYAIGSAYPPESVQFLFPREGKAIPTDADSEEAQTYRSELEKQILSLPQVKALLASASPAQQDQKLARNENPATHVDTTQTFASRAHYVLSRPFANLPKEMIQHSLTAGTLRKPGMLALPPFVLSKTRHGAAVLGGHQGDAFAFIHLGRNLCGHNGIVHGGLLATILDETLARTAFFHLPNKVGVTANLQINYKRPVRADQIIKVESRLTHAEGRKAYVEAIIYNLSNEVMATSTALFVEPKLIKWLDTSLVQRAMDQTDE